MRRVVLQLPDQADLGDTADLHDVVAYMDEVTIVLRLHDIHVDWCHDCSEDPPPIGIDHLLEQVLYLGQWSATGAANRIEHADREFPPLIDWRPQPDEDFPLAA